MSPGSVLSSSVRNPAPDFQDAGTGSRTMPERRSPWVPSWTWAAAIGTGVVVGVGPGELGGWRHAVDGIRATRRAGWLSRLPSGLPGGARSNSSDSCPSSYRRGEIQGDAGLAGSAVRGQQVDPAAGQQVGRAVLPARRQA